jgi:tetratricopeptide (TPR) repeat protein
MQTPASNTKAASWAMALLLIVATMAAYQPAWHAGFIWDDDAYVTQNHLLTAPDGLKRIWFSLDVPSQYFPLTYTVFRLERSVWGLASSGYHWVNILLHAASAVILWGLLRRLRLPAAWLAAALFALHPVEVQSVAWVTELKNVLSLLLCLLATWAWVEFADERPGAWRYYAVALFFQALALFAKTTACTLPAALLLILWLQRKPIGLRRLAQIVPFLAMGFGMGLLSMWWENHHQGAVGEDFAIGWMGRVLVASRALWFYLGKLLWPMDLSFSYARWHMDPANPAQYAWLAACVVAGVVIAKSGRGLQVAALYYVAMLAPLLGFITEYTFRYTFVADHYQYAASIGPLALAAAGLDKLLVRWGGWKNVVYACLLLVLGTLTWQHCRTYADSETLWQTTLHLNPESWLAHDNYGMILLRKGDTDGAIQQYGEAIKIKPDFVGAQVNLGYALARRGRFDEAISHYEQAVKLKPDSAEAHNDLGHALVEKGRFDDAIAHYQKAIQFKPDSADAFNNLGAVYATMGRIDEAISQYQHAIRLRPGFANAHYNLAAELGHKGQIEQSILEFREAIRFKPDLLDARLYLGEALARTGRIDEAIGQYQETLRQKPDFAEARFNLGLALATQGKLDEAIRDFQEVIRLRPDATGARQALALALKGKEASAAH